MLALDQAERSIGPREVALVLMVLEEGEEEKSVPAMELAGGVTSALPPKIIVVPVIFSSIGEATSGSSLCISIFPSLSADVVTGWVAMWSIVDEGEEVEVQREPMAGERAEKPSEKVLVMLPLKVLRPGRLVGVSGNVGASGRAGMVLAAEP